MPIDGFSPTTALAPTLGAFVKAFQTGYEVKDVPAQTKRVLQTISQVTSDIKHARELRRRKSGLLDINEKKIVDSAIECTTLALATLEQLVEAPRADMEANFGKVSVASRLGWVLRDANNVQMALSTLTISHTSLRSEITVLRCRGHKGAGVNAGREETLHDLNNNQAPPPYHATKELLYLKRQATRRRRSDSGEIPFMSASTQTPMAESSGNPFDQAEESFWPTEPSGTVFELPGSTVAHQTSELNSLENINGRQIREQRRPQPQIIGQYSGHLDETSSLHEEVTMETETLIPGRREPLLLRWNSPGELICLNRAPASPAGRAATPQRLQQQSWLEWQASRPTQLFEDSKTI